MKRMDLLAVRSVKIDICKDATVSYRLPDGERLMGTALPVYAVDNVKQAEALQTRFCRLQYTRHPQQPNRPWFRLSILGNGTDLLANRPDGLLEVDDLGDIRNMFDDYFEIHLKDRLT